MAKYETDFNSISCGKNEFFATDGVVEIPEEFSPFIVDLVVCGELMLASDASALAEAQPEKPRRGRRPNA